jgi:hypothetical protein
MAAGILQSIPGDIPTPPFPFQPAAHVSKVKWLLAIAVLFYVWSLIRLLRSGRGQ